MPHIAAAAMQTRAQNVVFKAIAASSLQQAAEPGLLVCYRPLAPVLHPETSVFAAPSLPRRKKAI